MRHSSGGWFTTSDAARVVHHEWSRRAARVMGRCREDPLFFSRHVLGGEQPWARQAEILRALREHSRVAVRSGHGVGKTWTAARAALWFLYAHPRSIVLTTAPTQRQVVSILWAEIRRQARTARMPLGGWLTDTRIRLADDWFALGLSTDEPERFQGYHGEHLLLIFDEAPGVPEMIYEAARGLMTSRGARMLLIGNPTRARGPFYEAFRAPGWHGIHIPCGESPNVAPRGKRYPKLVSPEWIEEQRRDWGERSAAFRARVLGEFPEEDDSRLVPLSWLLAAQARTVPPCGSAGAPFMGVDVARFGPDRTVILVADGGGVREIHATRGISTTETTGRVIAHALRLRVPPARIAVDDAGVGGGVSDRLREQGWAVQEVNAAARARSAAFANRRAELYWMAREAFNPDNASPWSLPGDAKELVRELSAISYKYNSAGQIQIEGKESISAGLGGSPDLADALALAMAAGAGPSAPPRIWGL